MSINMDEEFEGNPVEQRLEAIENKLDDIMEVLAQLGEAIANISTPGGDFSVEYEE